MRGWWDDEMRKGVMMMMRMVMMIIGLILMGCRWLEHDTTLLVEILGLIRMAGSVVIIVERGCY